MPTDKLFTGQRLDETGLYYYGARYYDANMGRFISADTIVPDPANPQSYNRYSYCLNNPLRYIDPTGHQEIDFINNPSIYYFGGVEINNSSGSSDGGSRGSRGGNASQPELLLPLDKGSVSFPLQDIEGQLGDVVTIVLIDDGKVVKTFRFVWAETDRFGPRWVLSELSTPVGDYDYNTQLMAPQALADEVIVIRRQYMADDLNVTADVLEFVSPGISMIPPDFMLAAAGIAGIPGAALPVAIVVGVYAGAALGPDILRGAANRIEPKQ